MCEKRMNMSLVKYKRFVDEQILVVMGQMDVASKILDYLYLVRAIRFLLGIFTYNDNTSKK